MKLHHLLPAFLLAATPAAADPISAAIGVVVSGFGAFASTAVGSFILKGVASFAFSALANALTPRQKEVKPGIATEVTQTGGTLPQSIIFGRYATAGTFVAPPMAHGRGTDDTVDYLTYVIDLADYPINRVRAAFINEDLVGFNGRESLFGKEAGTSRYHNNAYLRWYDGTQFIPDSVLVDTYGEYERPWTERHVLKGVAYASVTFRYIEGVYDGLPQMLFDVEGARLYDPRRDDTVGGRGTQRFANAATHVFTRNPVVMIYNLMRGLRLADGSIYGLNVPADELPLDRWVAAMNVCDELVEVNDGVDVDEMRPRYIAGLEFTVDTEPLDVIQQLLNACTGQIADCGGAWNISVGQATFPRAHFNDEDLIVGGDKDTDFIPFKGLSQTFNGCHATYPEPAVRWQPKDAPPYYNAEWEDEDGGQRYTATLNLNAVPDGYQAQRLMREMVADNRRWVSHTVTLRPYALGLLPLDTITWTSSRNRYDRKLFEIARKTVDPETLCVTLQLRERSLVDYEYDYDEAHRPIPNPDSPSNPRDGLDNNNPPDGNYGPGTGGGGGGGDDSQGLTPTRPSPVDALVMALHSSAISETADGGANWRRVQAPFNGAEQLSALGGSYLVRTQTGEVWFANRNQTGAWRKLDFSTAQSNMLVNGDFEDDGGNQTLQAWDVLVGDPMASDSPVPEQQGGVFYARFDGYGRVEQKVDVIPGAANLWVDVWSTGGPARIGLVVPGVGGGSEDLLFSPAVTAGGVATAVFGSGYNLRCTILSANGSSISPFHGLDARGTMTNYQALFELVNSAGQVVNVPFGVAVREMDENARLRVYGALRTQSFRSVRRTNLGTDAQFDGIYPSSDPIHQEVGVEIVAKGSFRVDFNYSASTPTPYCPMVPLSAQKASAEVYVETRATPGWVTIDMQHEFSAAGETTVFIDNYGGTTFFDNAWLTQTAPMSGSVEIIATDPWRRCHYAATELGLFRVSREGEVTYLCPFTDGKPPISICADRTRIFLGFQNGTAQIADDAANPGLPVTLPNTAQYAFGRPRVFADEDGVVYTHEGGAFGSTGYEAFFTRDTRTGGLFAVESRTGLQARTQKLFPNGTTATPPTMPLGGGSGARACATAVGRVLGWRQNSRDLLWLDGDANNWGLSLPMVLPVEDMREVL